MAGIVKKIGKITRYETTEYVGTAKMLDLDRASEGEHDPSAPLGADDSQTGEFHAVAPGSDAIMQPTAADLRGLEPADPHAPHDAGDAHDAHDARDDLSCGAPVIAGIDERDDITSRTAERAGLEGER